jgi:hypothetical protein
LVTLARRNGSTGILRVRLDNRHHPCNFVKVMSRTKSMANPAIDAIPRAFC